MLEPAPVLLTDRLRLSLLAEEDAPELSAFAVRNREHLAPWSPPEPPDAWTLEASQLRIAAARRQFELRTGVRFWLRDRDDTGRGPLLGSVALSNIVLGPFRACYLGYLLDADAEGRGFMGEALRAVVRYAFDDLRLHRIMANYMPTNERSARVLRRLGFVVEGYARDYLFINGAFRDHVLTALTHPNLPDACALCTPRLE